MATAWTVQQFDAPSGAALTTINIPIAPGVKVYAVGVELTTNGVAYCEANWAQESTAGVVTSSVNLCARYLHFGAGGPVDHAGWTDGAGLEGSKAGFTFLRVSCLNQSGSTVTPQVSFLRGI